MRKLTALLNELGDWHRRNDDFTGFGGVSLQYRIWREGHVSRSMPGHKILCPEQPKHLRIVDLGVSRLPKRQRECVQVKFFSPLKDDGNAPTHREMASGMGISKYAFERNVSRAKKALTTILARIAVDMS